MTRLRCHTVERDSNDIAGKNPADTITLDETDRHRRRFAMVSDNGIRFLLELEAAMLLRENDMLRLSDGRSIRVVAKPEPLYAVRGDDAIHLLNLTWHVGNRHLASQILHDHILIRRDSVIRTMLEELGASVEDVSAGFNPVGGAYDHNHEHEHAHEHKHEHEHEQEHKHKHEHEHEHEHEHDAPHSHPHHPH